MEIIGEDLHIMNEAFLQAIEGRDEKALITMAKRQIDAGATALDINLGQNRNIGRLTPWLVETIQQDLDVSLLFSSHVLSQQRALEIHKGTATINAVTANPTELAKAMETAKYFQANLVILLVSPELTPTDVDGRLQLAAKVLETAEEIGLPQKNIYLDPVMSCRHDPASWSLGGGLPDIDMIIDSIRMIGELSEHRLKTILALSNSSICLAAGERSAFHCHLLPMLNEAGLDAVIMNCRDQNLMAVAKENKSIELAA